MQKSFHAKPIYCDLNPSRNDFFVQFPYVVFQDSSPTFKPLSLKMLECNNLLQIGKCVEPLTIFALKDFSVVMGIKYTKKIFFATSFHDE